MKKLIGLFVFAAVVAGGCGGGNSGPVVSTQTETIMSRLDTMGKFTLLSDALLSATINLTLTPVN
jgi:hypothetical protein